VLLEDSRKSRKGSDVSVRGGRAKWEYPATSGASRNDPWSGKNSQLLSRKKRGENIKAKGLRQGKGEAENRKNQAKAAQGEKLPLSRIEPRREKRKTLISTTSR